MSATQPLPKLMLTADRLRALLDAGGYDSAIIAAHRQQDLPVGCSVALQFGDGLTRGTDETMHLPVKGSIVLNGGERRVAEVTRWQIGKVVPMVLEQRHLLLALDVELLLGSTVRLDDVLLRGGEVLRHLRLLLADARATLSSVSADDRRDNGSSTLLRIEARFAADLAVGRCGLVRPKSADGRRSTAAPVRMTSHQVRADQIKAAMAACDGLADHVLQDLPRAMRTAIGPEHYRAVALRLPVLPEPLRSSPREDDHALATSRTLQ